MGSRVWGLGDSRKNSDNQALGRSSFFPWMLLGWNLGKEESKGGPISFHRV